MRRRGAAGGAAPTPAEPRRQLVLPCRPASTGSTPAVAAFLWTGGGQKIDGSRIVDSAVQLGMHMRELWGQKAGFAIALAIATLAATRVLFGFSLLPPGLEHNSQGLASASTQVVIDTPRSSIIDLRED